MSFRLGLIGYPLGHSLSPAIHQAALAALRLTGEYQLYPVVTGPGSAAELKRLLDRLRHGELHGLNVTIPYKQDVLPFVDLLSPVAQAVGAANTLYMEENRLVGDNTDVPGFLADLQLAINNISPLSLGEGLDVRDGNFPSTAGGGARVFTALVLGAGGSARAVVYALMKAGWQVNIAARRLEQGRQLADEMRGSHSESVKALPFDAEFIEEVSTRIKLIVNTTPVGMHPHPGVSPWPETVPLPPGAFVYDLVYNPPETELLRRARARGLRGANGLGMLVEQAAQAFERWTSQSAPRREMLAAARVAIEREI